ncbi:hypothetical protein IGI04_029589 [Brassica rapa subsp. trilocularis]|uniref:Uncharacterized protein n=1 Tax=Brassica rapa subsp. trilocularis TaxID=1813537 RepID=A0ABQ7LR24_BRACM|nr:hypothetical protein IGI04_029589 [Brassica rapa subsp. trilocularis]
MVGNRGTKPARVVKPAQKIEPTCSARPDYPAQLGKYHFDSARPWLHYSGSDLRSEAHQTLHKPRQSPTPKTGARWWLFSDGHASSSLEDEILVYASSWTSCLFPCLCPHEVLIGSATPPPSSSRRVFPFIVLRFDLLFCVLSGRCSVDVLLYQSFWCFQSF